MTPRILYLGYGRVGRACLKDLLAHGFTIAGVLCRASDRGDDPAASVFRLATDAGLRVFNGVEPADTAFLRDVSSLAPDLLLSVQYDPVAIARRYEQGGATAISVLTEPTFFDGALEHLSAVRRAVDIPLLRKDFIVEEYQLFEARAAGADAVLLIVAALDQATLVRLQKKARELELAQLVEVHNEEEMTRAIDAGARVIGVNNRSLRTLHVDVEASFKLASMLPPGVVGVSESGLRSREDLEKLTAAGYRAFLIGERFMTAPDPAAAIGELIGDPVPGPCS